MTPPPDERFACPGDSMTLPDALALLSARIVCTLPAEKIPLVDATGRILAEEVIASHDVPPYDNAAVDGYAFAFETLARQPSRRLIVRGRASAGHPFMDQIPADAAVRIFTGATMPDGLDTVAMQEDCRLDAGHVVIPAHLVRGANRRRAGEDIRAGAIALRRGRRLGAREIGLAAAVGCELLSVYRRPRVAVFSTGDELREPGDVLGPGQIHDTNRYALRSLVAGLGAEVTDLGIIADRPQAIVGALAAAAEAHDAVVTSGGMSVGEEDHVKDAVRTLGQLHFWRLAIKPGRPIGLGDVLGVPFIGLPGNPAAMFVTFLRLARPLLLGLAGCTETTPQFYKVRAAFAHAKKRGRREWLRARLSTDEDGAPCLRTFPSQGSAILSSLVTADGLVELGEDLDSVTPGAMVDFLPFNELN